MPLKDYAAVLQALVAATPFATATSLSYEERPPSAGFVRGTIRFMDGSQIDFKEFLITQPTLQVIKYQYLRQFGFLTIFTNNAIFKV